MDFDAVEAGRQCIRSTTLEVVDDIRDFRKLERARLGDVGECSAYKSLAVGADRGRRHRLSAIHLPRGVRDAANMPELDEDVPAALMHAVRDFLPAFDLLLRIDAGRVLIALALLRD